MSRLRSSTVEPVLGTLINFLNMKRVNTRGIDLANKHVMMAALTYNLKKYMKFISKKAIAKAIALPVKAENAFADCFDAILPVLHRFKPLVLCVENYETKNNRPLKGLKGIRVFECGRIF
jgi:hypothetical protein